MKKNLIIPLVVASLSVAFVIISLLVLITKGNNVSFIRSKLKIGGLILLTTAMFYSCSSYNNNELSCYQNVANPLINNNDNITSKCYDMPVFENTVRIQNDYHNGFIILNLSETNVIKGYIEYLNGNNSFSYAIIEATVDTQKMEDIVQIGDIDIQKSETNNSYGNFEIIIDKDLDDGDYYLFFYEFSSDKIKDYPNDFLTAFNLRISK